jgi:electron transport complex protein RnfB
LVEAVVSLLAIGAVFGSLLAAASRVFAVEVDPRVEAAKEILPGANCGACGYAGCAGFAEALGEGKAPPDGCPVGGPEVTREIADILGVEVAVREREVARVLCAGGHREAPRRFEYVGIADCRAAALVAGGGPKACTYGCLGLGTCERVCRFDAVYINENGLPEVLEDRCTGCGECTRACPKNIILMAPVSRRVHILCSSLDRGAAVRKVCKVGCIGCKRCLKECPQEAIAFKDNLARIEYAKCDNCEACVASCPTGAIVVFKAAAEEQVERQEEQEKREAVGG